MPEVNSSPRKLTAPRALFETVSKLLSTVGGDSIRFASRAVGPCRRQQEDGVGASEYKRRRS
ncbi:hypothetical protein C6V06_14140 [Burkholderia gladioli]|nr:hypothetical protein C6V06_14140 [Burkholderia gladioli]